MHQVYRIVTRGNCSSVTERTNSKGHIERMQARSLVLEGQATEGYRNRSIFKQPLYRKLRSLPRGNIVYFHAAHFDYELSLIIYKNEIVSTISPVILESRERKSHVVATVLNQP